MPELPEVENFKKYIDKTSLNKEIKEVELANTILLLKTSEKKLIKTLEGNVFESTSRHGKYLFIQLKKGGFLVFHFGMSGYLEYRECKKSIEGYSLLISFNDNRCLSYTDKRKLGKIGLIKDIQDFVEDRAYGPDALQISEEEFLETLINKRGSIKSVLMDQHLIAGVGNEYSDEILFQAHIDPESKTDRLSKPVLSTIFEKMQDVLQQGIIDVARNGKKQFFIENRKSGLPCPSQCGDYTEVKKIGGRSSYFCPNCQKLIK